MNSTTPSNRSLIRGNLLALIGAGFVLLFDVAFEGSYLLSIVVCPIWFFVSLVRNGIIGSQLPVTLFRVVIPATTLGIALANASVQWSIAEANAEQVVRACEKFHSACGRYPQTLKELVPSYLTSIPRAKYCAAGNFYYYNSEDDLPILWWNKFGYYRKVYTFDRKQWGSID